MITITDNDLALLMEMWEEQESFTFTIKAYRLIYPIRYHLLYTEFDILLTLDQHAMIQRWILIFPPDMALYTTVKRTFKTDGFVLYASKESTLAGNQECKT